MYLSIYLSVCLLCQIFKSGAEGGAGATAGVGLPGEEGGGVSRGQMDNDNIKRMLELLCNEAGELYTYIYIYIYICIYIYIYIYICMYIYSSGASASERGKRGGGRGEASP